MIQKILPAKKILFSLLLIFFSLYSLQVNLKGIGVYRYRTEDSPPGFGIGFFTQNCFKNLKAANIALIEAFKSRDVFSNLSKFGLGEEVLLLPEVPEAVSLIRNHHLSEYAVSNSLLSLAYEDHYITVQAWPARRNDQSKNRLINNNELKENHCQIIQKLERVSLVDCH